MNLDKIYYISEKNLQNNHAGSKARIDIDNILEKNNFEKYENFSQIIFTNKLIKLLYICSPVYLKKLFKLVKLKNKFLIMQYPFYFDFITRYFFEFSLQKNQTFLFLHDIDSLRSKDNDSIKKEVSILNKAACVVVHNEQMQKFLIKNGLKCESISLKIFDYLLKGPLPLRNFQLGYEIVFAGNLAKSNFLKSSKLTKLGLIFNLYGPGYDENIIISKNISYKGSYGPEEIPYKIEGSFGLIWDGDSLDNCSGIYGKYLKYNNPHKLSLYIASGIPVITWKKAAIANFIEKYNIGFTVNSLYEISTVIEELTLSDYEEYKNNLKKLQKKVCNGFFTQKALDKISGMIN